MRLRKARLLAGTFLLVPACVLLADWREWIAWPDIISEYTSFDRFEIMGEAPWCFLGLTLRKKIDADTPAF